MFARQRGVLLIIGLLCALGAFSLPAWSDAVSESKEREADALLTQGNARMKVASYEEAIVEFNKIILRYPETDTSYKAQFLIADADVALKKEDEAMKELQAIVKQESPDWSPQALMKIGDIYSSDQKYTEAFNNYKQVIADYPESPEVDHAYFAIAKQHFVMGHYAQAAAEYDMVGTAYASRMPDLQKVSPGEPLHIRLSEPNLVGSKDTKLEVTITAQKSGDKETLFLLPEIEGGDHFAAAIPTELGTAKPGDGVLQVYGNDVVTLSYKSRYVGDGAVEKTIPLAIADNARVYIKDSTGTEVRGIIVSDTLTIEVDDPSRDITDAPDTVTVQAKTKKGGDKETITCTETGNHTGVFRGTIRTMMGDPKASDGILETNADLMEGSTAELDDKLIFSYINEKNLAVQDTPGPVTITRTLTMYKIQKKDFSSPDVAAPTTNMDITSMLLKGKSLLEIASTYRDLGQSAKAANTFRQAAEQFDNIRSKYPHAPEVEDALYGLFQVYVAQDQYDAAIGVIGQISRQFPQSDRAQHAMFDLAAIHLKREEYDRALAIYQNLLAHSKGTPLAEEAQYAICTTYTFMLKPKADKAPSPVSREQVAAAWEEFSRTYPNSERAPDAMFQLVNFRFAGDDFHGTVDAARRMVAMFPDNVVSGRVMLLMAQAQYKLRDFDGARTTLTAIIADYGDEADAATKLLSQIDKKTKN